MINPHRGQDIKALFVVLLSITGLSARSQGDTIVEKINRFGGAVTVTNNGISTIPNLTLGKPAAIFDMVAGRKLTFEPQFRFALEGKPWSFTFWWRYNIFNNDHFRLVAGAHPAIVFKSLTDTSGGLSKKTIRADRYLAGELVPTVTLNKYLGFGLYYLYSRGIEKYIIRNTNMISFRTYISNIPVAGSIKARFTPQLYYLRMDKKHGTYLNASIVLNKKNFPLSVSGLINKKLSSEIPGDDFLWNVSLIYAFSNEYVKHF